MLLSYIDIRFRNTREKVYTQVNTQVCTHSNFMHGGDPKKAVDVHMARSVQRKALSAKRSHGLIDRMTRQSPNPQRHRFRKSKYQRKPGTMPHAAFYNEMPPHEIPTELIGSLGDEKCFVRKYDDLDAYCGVDTKARRHPTLPPLSRSSVQKTKYVVIERNRHAQYLEFAQNEHRRACLDSGVKCHYPNIVIECNHIAPSPEDHFASHCSRCLWHDKNSFSTDTRLTFEDKSYSELFLRQVEGSHELSIGHGEYMVQNGIYRDEPVISHKTFDKYSSVMDRIAKQQALKSIEKAKSKVAADKLKLRVMIDGSVTNGRKRRDGQNGFLLTLAPTKDVIHVEVVSKRKGGNFKGNSCNMEVFAWTETLRKLTLEGWSFASVCHDDKASFDLVTAVFCRLAGIPMPISIEDINHWQLHGGTKLSKEVKRLLDIRIAKKEEILETDKNNQVAARLINETVELKKRCSIEWGRRVVLRLAQLLRKAAPELTYCDFIKLLELRIVPHYAPRNEAHSHCTKMGYKWCTSKGDAEHRNWISTSQHPLPIERSGYLQKLVLQAIKSKILAQEKCEALMVEGSTIFNEMSNGVCQKYANKRKCHGASRYAGQVFRGVCQVNEGVEHHRQTLSSLGCAVLSSGQESAIKNLKKRRQKRYRQYKRQGNPSKLNKRKFYDVSGETVTLEEAFKLGILKKNKDNRVTNSDDEDSSDSDVEMSDSGNHNHK